MTYLTISNSHLRLFSPVSQVVSRLVSKMVSKFGIQLVSRLVSKLDTGENKTPSAAASVSEIIVSASQISSNTFSSGTSKEFEMYYILLELILLVLVRDFCFPLDTVEPA